MVFFLKRWQFFKNVSILLNLDKCLIWNLRLNAVLPREPVNLERPCDWFRTCLEFDPKAKSFCHRRQWNDLSSRMCYYPIVFDYYPIRCPRLFKTRSYGFNQTLMMTNAFWMEGLYAAYGLVYSDWTIRTIPSGLGMKFSADSIWQNDHSSNEFKVALSSWFAVPDCDGHVSFAIDSFHRDNRTHYLIHLTGSALSSLNVIRYSPGSNQYPMCIESTIWLVSTCEWWLVTLLGIMDNLIGDKG